MTSTRYRLAGLIKRGGMAEVHDAYLIGESGFERRVAIKRLLPESAADPAFLLSFADEARIASRLHHANIVPVIDFGLMDGRPFMVLERVDGEDLSSLLERAGHAPLAVALHIATEVGHALAHAHRARDQQHREMKIVHRDVSPENVLLSWDGDVKLTDFGIAFARRRLEATQIGVAKGKLPFMAPEQQRGDDVDARADLFALGCLLHKMIAGRTPFNDEPARFSAAVLDPSLPADVSAIVDRAVRLDRSQRYASAADFAADLGRALASRLSGDTRTLIRSWVAPFHPAEALKAAAGGMFDLELVLGAVEEAIPRYVSVRAPLPRSSGSGEPSAEHTAPSLVGSALGSYRIEALIGESKNARVYRARHTVLDRVYALKILAGAAAESEAAQERFRREARALSKIQHSNVVGVFDFGTTSGGESFLLMELVEGETLSKWIAREAPFPPRRAAGIVRQIAEALVQMHALGLIHRDLKPSNLVVSASDRVKILDFGICKDLDRQTALTRLGDMVGTPVYMSPEQMRGEEIDPRTDLFALGVIFYELLARSRPFKKPGDQLALDAPPLPPCGGYELIVSSLLARGRSLRPWSAAEVLARLDALEAVSAEPQLVTAIPAAKLPPAAREKTLTLPLALVSIALGGVIVLAVDAVSREDAPVVPVPLPLPAHVEEPAIKARPMQVVEPVAAPAPVTEPLPVPVPAPGPAAKRVVRRDAGVVDAGAPEPVDLQKVLQTIASALGSEGDPLPEEQRLTFEQRYLDLRSRARRNLEPAALEKLAADALELRREISRASLK